MNLFNIKNFMNKIVNELKLKYTNLFTYSKYQIEELNNDIKNNIKLSISLMIWIILSSY